MKMALLAIIFAQLAWITFLPLFQTPDEQAHFGQINVVSVTGNDFIPPSNLSKEILTTEELLGTLRNSRGDNKYTYHPEFNIEYSQTTFGPLERKIINLPMSDRATFTINEATSYPPLYYRLGSFLISVVFSTGFLQSV